MPEPKSLEPYESARLTKLKTGPRYDAEVGELAEIDAIIDVLPVMRQFFDRLLAEAEERRHDPVAMTNAQARLETIQADIRYITDTVRRYNALVLESEKIRRLTVSGVATVEGVSSLNRTNWQHERLLVDMLRTQLSDAVITHDTGELVHVDELAKIILGWLRPEWRLTPIKEAGYDPHDYCDVETDDDGKPLRTPGVRIVDNLIRRST